MDTTISSTLAPEPNVKVLRGEFRRADPPVTITGTASDSGSQATASTPTKPENFKHITWAPTKADDASLTTTKADDASITTTKPARIQAAESYLAKTWHVVFKLGMAYALFSLGVLMQGDIDEETIVAGLMALVLFVSGYEAGRSNGAHH